MTAFFRIARADSLALPLSFIGLPDWHIIRWIKLHPMEFKVSLLIFATLVLVIVLLWAIIALELERYRRRVREP